MGTGIDQSFVQCRLLVARSVAPDWIWSHQGDEIWMLDATDSGVLRTRAVGVYSGSERIVTDRWGQYSPTRRYVLAPSQRPNVTIVHDTSTSEQWELPRLGIQAKFNPKETHLADMAWESGSQPSSRSPADLIVARINGHNRRHLMRTYGAVIGWRADGALVVVGHDTSTDESTLRILSIEGQLKAEWPLGWRIRNMDISPNGTHMTFAVILDKPSRNGLFVINLFSGRRRAMPSRMSTRWLPGEEGLLAIPLRRAARNSFQIWRIAFPDLYVEGALTDPDKHQIDMETMGWQISPSGTCLAFRTPRNGHMIVVTWRPEAGSHNI